MRKTSNVLRKFLLSIALLLCCTATANAANPDAIEIGGIYYILNKGNHTATVTWGGEMMRLPTEEYSGDIVIPEKITYHSIDFTVTSIGESAFEGCRLTSITIPSSVTSIGESAFKGSSLTSITIPSSVTSIGHRAFYNCSNLTSITIPSSVTSIGGWAFYNCSNLTSITIPNSVTSIGDGAFNYCTGLTSITIPSSVTSIGESAFDGCSGLTSITIPSSVTSIGGWAFAECRNLKSVYVSWKAPLAISDNVFSGLRTSEITLHIPYGTLNAYSTANTWSTFDLDGIVLFADVNAEAISIENWDSNHDGLLSTKEAAAVTDLGDAFSNSTITSFNELKYFKNLTSIGKNAFSGCSMLKSINIPNSVTNIESGAFKGTSITSIEFPATITSIGESAFENCRNLKSVTIPATITSIGENAFKGCSGLEEIYVKVQSPLPISSNVFENVATTCLLRVPYGSVTSYQEADVWKSFSNIQDNAIQFEDPEVKAICLANWDTNKDGVLTYEEAAAVRDLNSVFENNTTITSFNELKYFTGITTMWRNFSGCTNLKEITIPNGVTSINAYTFRNCTNLASITIPNSVTSIGSNAFEGCTNLQNVNINVVDFANNNIIYDYFGTSKTIKYYYNGEVISGDLTISSTTTAIGNNALKGVTGLTSVTIPNSVTSIGSNAFYGCTGLTSVTIPNSVTSIGSNAFYGCTNLQNIGINIVDFANNNIIYDYFGTSKTIKYYYNGEEISGELTIPNTTASIGNNALKGVTGLTSVTIPNSVTAIGSNAFEGCTNLQNIGINIIDFANNNIIYDYFGTSKTIKYYYNGEEISGKLTIPSTTITIGNNVFKGVTGLTSVTIPNSVTNIGSNAFYGCTGLTSVTIPNSVTSIGSNAFEGCTNLQNIGINIVDFANNNIIYDYFGTSKTIKYYYNGEEISGELVIPENTTSIGNNALKGVTGLTSVTIPSSVTAIGSNAFEGCTELETVSVQWTEADKIPDISGKNVFNGIALSDVTLDIPYKKGNIRSLYTAKDVWKNFNIVFAKNFIITKSDNTTIEHKASENSDIVIDESDITKLLAVEDVPSVKSITYTRDFTNVAGKWQAWFVPFEAPLSALNDAELDVAEVAGILLDEDENTIVAFKKVTDANKKLNANTPYVVRLKADATNKAPALVFENANLKATEEDSFSIQSAYDIFTFTGNYESKAIANSYSLNTKGEFQKMANDAVLGPMRFSLSVSSRDDSPYGSSSMNPTPRPKISYMILGDDSSLQPIDGDLQQDDEKTMRAMTPAVSLKPRAQQTFIYDLRGRKVNRIQSKQVYIIDGKKFIAR